MSRPRSSSAPTIVITAKDLPQNEWNALDGHVLRVFSKPAGGNALASKIGRAIADS